MTIRLPSEEKKLLAWRARLKADRSNVVEDVAVRELISNAKALIGYYFRSSPLKSHKVVRRELRHLAKGLERASKALIVLGPEGMLRLHAAAGLMADETAMEKFVQSGKILVLARWAREAAHASLQDDRGPSKPGPVSDTIFQGVVLLLAELFELHLQIDARYGVRTAATKTDSMFKEFLIAAISDFKPAGVRFSWRKLDTAAQVAVRELRSRS